MANVISKDGTAIAFDKTGKGEPVILVDGALCSRAFGPMHKIAALLAAHFTVYTYDRRGRNESGDTMPYSVQREIEDLEALINEAGGAAFVAGFSSGAGLALNAAANGLNIKKLALYEPPYISNMGGHNPPADCEAQLKQLVASGKRGAAVKFFMKDMVGVPTIMAGIMSLLPVWSKLKAVAHTLPYDAAIMGSFSLPAQLAASVKIPTLVAGGGKSPVGLRNTVQKTAEAIPGASLMVLKGQNHNVAPNVIAPVLTDYFNK